MAGWIEQLKKRKAKGVKPAEIVFDDSAEPIVIPLRYPKAADKAAVMEIIDEVNKLDEKKATTKEIIDQNDRLMLAVVKGCIEGDAPPDDELHFLLNEIGGFKSDFAKRCQRLMGIGGDDDEPKPTDRSAHRTKKTRGR